MIASELLCKSKSMLICLGYTGAETHLQHIVQSGLFDSTELHKRVQIPKGEAGLSKTEDIAHLMLEQQQNQPLNWEIQELEPQNLTIK